jgi:rhodanese-related sulfurtransferase
MKRTLLSVATGFLLLTTTGCFDTVWKKCQEVCSSVTGCTGCCGSAEEAPKNAHAHEGAHKHEHAHAGKTISAEDLKNQMETDASLVVINVLPEEYYNDCHIIGSLNMPLAELDKKIEGIEKKAPIVVYCAHSKCPASAQGAQRLHQLGYTNVKMYEGGMKEWVELGFSYDGEAEMDYLEMKK